MLIELTDEQLEKCVDLAQARHDAKHASFRNRDTAKFTNDAKSELANHKKINIPQEYMAHFIGLLGEMAYSIYSHEPLDEEIYAVRDNGEDFSVLEVKTITYRGDGEAELKVPEVEFLKRDQVEIYVLARANIDKPSEVELLGYIDRKTYSEKGKTKKYGRYLPKNIVLGESQLEKFV